MTRHDNRLRSDAVNFGLKLSPELLGVVACHLVRVTVDPKVGAEVALVFTEEPAYATRYATITDLKLSVSTAIVPTPYGPVGAIIWQIGAGTSAETYVEQFINPGNAATVAIVREAAQQTKLRLAIVDNRSGDMCSVSEFENVFRLGDLVERLDAIRDEAKPETFEEAMQFAKINAKLIDKIRSGEAG